MSRTNAPCKDCPDRHAACHDKCEKYQDFKKECFNYNLKVEASRGYLEYLGEQKADSYFEKIKKRQKGVK